MTERSPHFSNPQACKWEKIGKVAIDTGSMWMIDPVYKDKVKEDYPNLVHANGTKLGVVFGTGAGDGTYDVMALMTPNGAVAAIKVEFLTECRESDDRA